MPAQEAVGGLELDLYGGQVVAQGVVDLARHPGALLGDGELPYRRRVVPELGVGRLQLGEQPLGLPAAPRRLQDRRARGEDEEHRRAYRDDEEDVGQEAGVVGQQEVGEDHGKHQRGVQEAPLRPEMEHPVREREKKERPVEHPVEPDHRVVRPEHGRQKERDREQATPAGPGLPGQELPSDADGGERERDRQQPEEAHVVAPRELRRWWLCTKSRGRPLQVVVRF